jgi:ABC-type sugar transport system permease subunit
MKSAKAGSYKKKKTLQAILSILPVVIILLLIRAYPMVSAVYRSFTNWDGMYKNDWVGLANYTQIFTNSPFWTLLQNNLVLLISVPLQVIIGLLIAVLLYEEVLGWRFFRALYYVPQIMSAVIIGYLFRIFFGLNGPLNIVLTKMGLTSFAIEWLGNRASALTVIVICLVWFSIGWQAIVILGGMSGISPSIFEAARIDGANYWQRTFKVLLPMLSRVMEYCVIMSMVWTLTGLFPFIYSMTKGGPGYETTTIDFMIYVKSFLSGGNLGLACALAVILLIIILAFTLIEMKITDKLDDGGRS